MVVNGRIDRYRDDVDGVVVAERVGVALTCYVLPRDADCSSRRLVGVSDDAIGELRAVWEVHG